MTHKRKNTDIDETVLYRLDEEGETDLTSYSLPDEDEADDNENNLPENEDIEEDDIDTVDPGDTDEADDQQSGRFNRKAGITLLLKILATPVEGWKEMKRRHLPTDTIASSIFYPLVALASVSEFIKVLYGSVIPLSYIVKEAVVVFVALFFGYFTVILTGNYLLPSGSRDSLKTATGKNLTMMAMSTLALFMFFYNALPMIDPVLVFLPLWTIYIVCKGVKILRIPKDIEIRTKGTLCCLIIGAPLLWDWLLSELLGL